LPERPKARLARQLALQGSEQLDALGVIKRRGGDVEQFTAYSRLAADTWIAGLTPNQQCYADLPYDAQLLYDFRLANALGQAQGEGDTAAMAALQALQRELRVAVKAAGGAPVPYAVILQADGDRMGELLGRATQAEQSRRISRALHGFASAVRGLVRAHRGHAIYAGGDDVLALLPLNSAVAAAEALATAFQRCMGGVATDLGMTAAQAPTLSVGLGIGHLVEPLGQLRERALRAEQLAKGNARPMAERRNALGILLGIRSGGETPWRARWNQTADLAELQAFTAAYAQGELPSRVAYDLRAIDQRLRWLADDPGATAIGMRRAEVARMLERARTRGDAPLAPQQQATLLHRAGETPLGKLADTLIIARWLAARTQAEVEKP
jgi:CRISPR-associated protein Cmr2